MNYYSRVYTVLAGCLMLALAPTCFATEITLRAKDLTLPGLRLEAIQLQLVGGNQLEARIGEIAIAGKQWRDVRVTCPALELRAAEVACPNGVWHDAKPGAIAFRYAQANNDLELSFKPAPREEWWVFARFGNSPNEPWSVEAKVINGALERIAGLLPKDWPHVRSGRVSGTFNFAGRKNEPQQASATLAVHNLKFSDSQGLHAGEKIAADITLNAERGGPPWRWRVQASWREGEVFWTPLYLKSGQVLSARGLADSRGVRIEEGALELKHVGTTRFSAEWNKLSDRLLWAQAKSENLNLSMLYQTLLQPFLSETALGKLRIEGSAALDWTYSEGETQSVELRLSDAFLEDRERRFALFGVNAAIPWNKRGITQVLIRFTGGELLRVPFGAARVEPTLHGFAIALPDAQIPLLDGAIEINDFHAERADREWRWRFKAGLSPVSMQALTNAVQLPTMHGTLSAVTPSVRYERSTLTLDGALLIDVFDGTISVNDLSMLEPFGLTPRLYADVAMRKLDLDRLTRAFSFGSITGRIDVSVGKLELANWRPVAFDAKIESSPGDYPKRISQRAVENISALGGAGATAAIQRSFLRFFDEFGYSKIGWSCRMRNEVCEMGGIEPASPGYVIVKSGGIPAISVVGYNRRVDWSEFIERLKRITRENSYVVD
jgi:hypothetical protein